MNKFRLVTTGADNNTSVLEFSVLNKDKSSAIQEFVIVMNKLGYKLDKYNSNQRQRTELQGMPLFHGLYGAMFDGDAIRYEDKKTYEALST